MAKARSDAPVLTAHAAGLVGCRTCGLASSRALRDCPRCEAPLQSREPDSLQKVWAFLIVGIVCYIPANLYPMLVTSLVGDRSAQTIVGGVVELVHHHAYGIAAIVGIASVLIPVSKFIIIAFLAYSVRRPVRTPIHSRVHLFEFVEFVGRWSMIDVFVVAILSSLVQMGFVASINPGPAAVFFALSVAFTMLSAIAFDPRLIWDASTREAAPQ